MSISRQSLSWQLLTFLYAGAAIIAIATWFGTPVLIKQGVEEEAITTAQNTVRQFKIIRGYYTNNVIKKALASGALKPSIDHKTRENGIPLPATLIHDLSELLKKEGMTVKLYSPFPFPNRSTRSLDTFGQGAWDALKSDPKSTFSSVEDIDGISFVRVGLGDTMGEVCVTCHNNHPDTPKNDWKIGDLRGVLEVNVDITKAIAGANATGRYTALGIIVLFGGVISLFTMKLRSAALKPIAEMTETMKRLADHDYSVDVPATDREDELGHMGKAVEFFKDNLIKADDEAQAQRDRQETRQKRAEMIEGAVGDFESAVGTVISSVTAATDQLQSSARDMSATAQSAAQKASSIEGSAERATDNVQSVATATEELTSSVTEISGQVSQSATIASSAVEEAKQTNDQVSTLSIGANKIGEVVALINDIADQTNLLALNATIEAARAGEAGKGFAVVASEVKNLANQTSKATQDIAEQVSAIQSSTEEAVGAIQHIGETINTINTTTSSVASAVEEQGAATQEIARNTHEAATETQSVTSTISDVSQAASQTDEAANEVLQSSQELVAQFQQLRDQVTRFLDTIKAA